MEMLNNNESVVFVYGKGYSYWFEEIDNKYM